MATFWTPNRSLQTGDGQVEAIFVDGLFETNDPDVINMLRTKIKMRIFEIVETTPVDKPKTTKTK